MKTLAFFNNKGGVGKTVLVYHLGHMFAELGSRVLLVDLDPQSNLTAMCLPDDRLEELWPDSDDHPGTVLGCVRPILRGLGDVRDAHIESVGDNLDLIPGDLGLSRFEDKLSDAWPRALDRDEGAFRALSAFYRLAMLAARSRRADLILFDVGPNLGAINRAGLLATDFVVTPLAPDLFSLQGLRNLGPTLTSWRADWQERLKKRPADLELPSGAMKPAGYLVMQAGMRLSRPVKAYQRWVARMPGQYHRSLLSNDGASLDTTTDDYCLGVIKHYQSLMPLAQDAQKPMFSLKSGDGAIGAHQQAVARCRDDFREIAESLLARLE